MTFKRSKILLLVAAVLAQGAIGEPRAKNTEDPFEMGKSQFQAGKYVRALGLFSRAIQAADKPAQKNKAFYYQGLVLFELGLYYSAYVSFRNVLSNTDAESRTVYEKAIKNSVIIADKLNIVERIGKALKQIPGQYIPASVQGHAYYAVGAYHLAAGDMANAQSSLKSVNPDNPFFPKALFLLGVIATRTKNYREAEFYFAKASEACRGKRELNGLNELARLNLARTSYAEGKLEQAVEYYSQFSSNSAHWITILLEASWPLLRINDTTVSLGNLHTVLSPYYREDLVGEAYVLRSTILFSLCKYEEMRQTLAQFFTLYDPILQSMMKENNSMGSHDDFYNAFKSGRGLNAAFINFAKRDVGFNRGLKVLQMLEDEKRKLVGMGRNEQIRRLASIIEEAISAKEKEMGGDLQRLHQRKLRELREQREQANYLKVEIVTGEKQLIEAQKGLPAKRVVDVDTDVSSSYHFWPFNGEYWEDELGAYVYTSESACVN
jgi:tetratricopeptide (TPR) repeat protein